jgi:general secretion pathway protein C
MSTLNLPLWRIRITTFVLAALAAGSASYWVLKWTNGPTAPTTQQVSLPTVPVIDTSKLAQMLGAAAPAAANTTADVPANPNGKFKLLGVIAQGTQHGSALIATDGQPAKPYRVGEHVTDDLLLVTVNARSVMLGLSLKSTTGVALELPSTPGTR